MGYHAHITGMKSMGNAYSIKVERSEGKTALGRPRRRWMDNYIKMDQRGCKGEHVKETSVSVKKK